LTPFTLDTELPSPSQIKRESPLSEEIRRFVEESRLTAARIIERTDERLAAVVGPCSIHEPQSALEFAERIKKLTSELNRSFFPVMRFFIEKSRTRLGWKGMLYDPHLDGSDDIAAGIRASRKLLLQITAKGVPCAAELLEPLAVPYFDDLIVWGLIGARTSASQPHRQMASGLPFPVGFKNDIHGNLDVAISGIFTSRAPHSQIGMNSEGRIASIKTQGNPLAHLILRGSENKANFDADSVGEALSLLQKYDLPLSLIIDCSHGNSQKDPKKQRVALESVIAQIRGGNQAISGFMFESHIHRGNQSLGPDRSQLRYGVSVTDSCSGWEETESLLLWASEQLISINSVQS